MRLLVLLFIAFWSVASQAQNDQSPKDAQGRRHGLWKKYYDNGNLRYQGRFAHGIPVDTFKYFFEDGSLRTKNAFRGKSGNCMSYQYGEEILAAKGLYLNKQKDSVWTYYDREQNVIARETYHQGEKHGLSQKYHDNGRLAEVLHYDMGQKEGDWKQFYESGAKMAEGQYKRDKLSGEVTYFYSSGKPRSRGNYKAGLMDGTWYFFGDQLKLERKEIWKNGRQMEVKEMTKKQAK